MAKTDIIVPNIKILDTVLDDYHIRHDHWGEGPTKTLADLWKEINEGESYLVRTSKGELRRKVNRAQAYIYCERDGVLLFLREEKQVFANGHERIRDSSISVSEKLRRGERARIGMARGIKEELGIALTDLSCLKRLGRPKESSTRSSKSYPGLPSKHRMTRFRWDMPVEHFAPRGYIETQIRKTTYFGWNPFKEAA